MTRRRATSWTAIALLLSAGAGGCATTPQWQYADLGPPPAWSTQISGAADQPPPVEAAQHPRPTEQRSAPATAQPAAGHMAQRPPAQPIYRGQDAYGQPHYGLPGQGLSPGANQGLPNPVIPPHNNGAATFNGQPANGGPAPGNQPAGTGLDWQGFPGGNVAPASQPPFTPQAPFIIPEEPIDVDVFLEEAQTGRIMFGVGVNSDAGLIGNIVIDEQNFDLFRWPGSWRELIDGRGFRGAGQRFRLEALPGTEVQRYSALFQEPYLFGTAVSFGLSGFYYDRRFIDWDEQRVGGRVSLGWTFPNRPDLSTTVAVRAEQIKISDPRTIGVPELDEVVGDNDLFTGRWQVAQDTRDSAFLPTEGYLVQLAFEYGFGSFSYPRGEIDLRRYFVIRQRPDQSGRHVLGISGRAGYSGPETPLYEHFFAGGFSTIRGFDFRGASPVSGGVIVGGEFMFIASAEYRFPLTGNDQISGSFFFDAGTVEEDISDIDGNDIRLTPGFELRIAIPQMGPVPIAVGLGFPIQHAAFDDIRNFHFFVGISR